MRGINAHLQWFAQAVWDPGHPASARLTLYPDGRVRVLFNPPDLPDAYHVFPGGDFS